jgi:hypothetical protein
MMSENEIRLLRDETKSTVDRLSLISGYDRAKEFYRTRLEVLDFILTGERVTDPQPREAKQAQLVG